MHFGAESGSSRQLIESDDTRGSRRYDSIISIRHKTCRFSNSRCADIRNRETKFTNGSDTCIRPGRFRFGDDLALHRDPGRHAGRSFGEKHRMARHSFAGAVYRPAGSSESRRRLLPQPESFGGCDNHCLFCDDFGCTIPWPSHLIGLNGGLHERNTPQTEMLKSSDIGWHIGSCRSSGLCDCQCSRRGRS